MTSKVFIALIAAVVSVVVFTACSRGAVKTNSGASHVSESSMISAQSSSSSSASSAQSSSSASSYPNPDNDPLYAKAYGFYADKQYDQAVAVCDQALAQDPNCFWAYNIKGIAIYYNTGSSVGDSCLALIDKALAIDPEYSYAYFNKALIYKMLKQNDQSIACFNKDLALYPNDAWAYYGISTVYADTNQVDLSIEYLKKAIDLNPACKTEAKTEYHYDHMRDNAQFKALVDS